MNPTGQAQAAPTPAIVFETLMAFQKTAALRAAIEVGVFEALGEGLHETPAIARRCEASERGIRILCDFLTVNGLIAKQEGKYYHTPASAMFLDPKSPASLAPTARFLGTPGMHVPFAQLTEIVRTGHTILPGDGSVEPENPIWVEFAHGMAPMMAPMARPLGSIVLQGRTDPVRVLDIAAGHGLFGIEVAKQNPQARIVALDWAPVLEVARENARKAGVSERYELLAGSAFEVEFGGPYDIVLLTNFLHHFDAPTCVRLLKKVNAAMKPGGRAAALEFVPNEDRVSPPMAAAFSMTMLAQTPAGDAYTFSELESMFREAGFTGMKADPIPQSPHTVVIGVKG